MISRKVSEHFKRTRDKILPLSKTVPDRPYEDDWNGGWGKFYRAGREAGLDEAANAVFCSGAEVHLGCSRDIAAAIRALKEKP